MNDIIKMDMFIFINNRDYILLKTDFMECT